MKKFQFALLLFAGLFAGSSAWGRVTPTPPWTYTFTSSPTITPNFTATNTPTLTQTPTQTSSFTLSNTPTLTSTPTLTVSPTFTKTLTSTRTFTPTLTGSPTLTATPTLSFTTTKTSTISATPTSTSTFTQTSTVTSTITPSLPNMVSFPNPGVRALQIGYSYQSQTFTVNADSNIYTPKSLTFAAGVDANYIGVFDIFITAGGSDAYWVLSTSTAAPVQTGHVVLAGQTREITNVLAGETLWVRSGQNCVLDLGVQKVVLPQ